MLTKTLTQMTDSLVYLQMNIHMKDSIIFYTPAVLNLLPVFSVFLTYYVCEFEHMNKITRCIIHTETTHFPQLQHGS